MNGGPLGWARLNSGLAQVSADGTSGNVTVNSNTFPQGVALSYPDADGLAGDMVKTDGSGVLNLGSGVFESVPTSEPLEYEYKLLD